MKEFKKNTPYFQLLYCDRGFEFPTITSLVFLSSEEVEGSSSWIFQDAFSYFEVGEYPDFELKENDSEVKNRVTIFQFNGKLLQSIYTKQELIKSF